MLRDKQYRLNPPLTTPQQTEKWNMGINNNSVEKSHRIIQMPRQKTGTYNTPILLHLYLRIGIKGNIIIICKLRNKLHYLTAKNLIHSIEFILFLLDRKKYL